MMVERCRLFSNTTGNAACMLTNNALKRRPDQFVETKMLKVILGRLKNEAYPKTLSNSESRGLSQLDRRAKHIFLTDSAAF